MNIDTPMIQSLDAADASRFTPATGLGYRKIVSRTAIAICLPFTLLGVNTISGLGA